MALKILGKIDPVTPQEINKRVATKINDPENAVINSTCPLKNKKEMGQILLDIH